MLTLGGADGLLLLCRGVLGLQRAEGVVLMMMLHHVQCLLAVLSCVLTADDDAHACPDLPQALC